jgi:hypothetical protein
MNAEQVNALIWGIIIGVLIGGMIGGCSVYDVMVKCALEAGAGEYRQVEPGSKVTEWHWTGTGETKGGE